MATRKTPFAHELRREYRIARQVEAARRLELITKLIYGIDSRRGPLDKVIALLNGTDNSELPDETTFALNLVIDIVLNDQPNNLPTPEPPADGTPE